MDAIWVHTDRQIIKSKAQESPAAEGQCMAGGRAQSSGHSCPRTEAMRTAAVQGGGQDTLAQGGSLPAMQILSLHTCAPALPLQRKDTLLHQLSRTMAPCSALLPPSPSASARAGLCFAIQFIYPNGWVSSACLSKRGWSPRTSEVRNLRCSHPQFC